MVVGAGTTDAQVSFAWVPSIVKDPEYCDPVYKLLVIVKLQLGAVCTKCQVIGWVMTCNPMLQLVLVISVVTV
jgi:hypothetical protein